MAIPNPYAAITTFLKANATVNSLSSGRVYVGELPTGQATSMPRAAVVVTGSGGVPPRDYVQRGNRRVDVRCYGASHYEASQLDLAVYEAMKQMGHNTTLYVANVESNGLFLRDADGEWPLVLSVYDVTVSEYAAA